jgi:hypothetical protein
MDQETLANPENYLYSTDGETYTSLSEDSGSNITVENDTTVTLMIPEVASGHMIRMRNLKTAGGDTCRTTTEVILPPIPMADPVGGLYNQTQYVMLYAVSGTVYYTLDGTAPDNTDNDTLFGSTIIVGDDENIDGKSWTLKAVTYDEAGNRSEVMSEEYLFDTSPPVITGVSIAPGSYGTGDTVTVTVYADDTGYQADMITVNGTDIDEGSFTDNGDNTYVMTYTVGAQDQSRSNAAEVPVMVTLADTAGNTATFEGEPASEGAVEIIVVSGIYRVYIPAGDYYMGDMVYVTVYADDSGYTSYDIYINNSFCSSEFDFTNNQDGTYTIIYHLSSTHTARSSVAEIPIDIKLYIESEGVGSMVTFYGPAETDPGGEVTLNPTIPD